jgi:aspartyl-tRNA(Asn)/glutamyl-tRNA(Gln) amidotransferase subunit C
MIERLTRADVERIAALARLALTEDEKRLFAGQLARVLDYVRQLDEIDTRDVPPASPVVDAAPVERADEARATLGRAAALANAPEAAGGLFTVPRAIDEA